MSNKKKASASSQKSRTTSTAKKSGTKSSSVKKSSGTSKAKASSRKKQQQSRIALSLILTLLLAASLLFADTIERALGIRGDSFIESSSEFDAEGSVPVQTVMQGEAVYHFIDVGQGDAIMLHMPQETAETDDGGAIPGTYILVDGGSENKDGKHDSTTADGKLKLMEYLSVTVGQIDNFVFDYVIASHEHEDHVGGLTAVLAEYSAKIIYRPNVEVTRKNVTEPINSGNAGALSSDERFWGTPRKSDTLTYWSFVQEAYRTRFLSGAAQLTKEVRVTNANSAAQNLIKGNNSQSPDYFEFRFHTPTDASNTNANNNSPIISVTYRGKKMMMSGDAEAKVEREFVNRYSDTGFGTADIIKLGHHGSNTSTTTDYLDFLTTPASRPNTLIVITVGVGNTYGHPTDKILQRLADYNFDSNKILRSDLNGDIIISISEEAGQAVIKFGAAAERIINSGENTPLRWWQIACGLWVAGMIVIWYGLEALKKKIS